MTIAEWSDFAPPLALQLLEVMGQAEVVIAVNVGGRNPDVMAVLASAGAHAAFIDCERTGIGLDVATELIRAAKVAGLTSLVRSWSKDPAVLVQFMDRQVDGLVVPHINCAQDAADGAGDAENQQNVPVNVAAEAV